MSVTKRTPVFGGFFLAMENQLEARNAHYCLVTVGTTKFESLIQELDEHAENILSELHVRGIQKLILQIGNTKHFPCKLQVQKSPVKVQVIKFADHFELLIRDAKLVISHAGAGSILESLRSNVCMLVVINDLLMDNHQVELATALARDHYLWWTNSKTLLSVLQTLPLSLIDKTKNTLLDYPEREKERFNQFLDNVMGFTGSGQE